MLLGNPLGAFLFSGLLAGYIYDKEAAKQHHDILLFESSSLACLGPECFRLTFLVLAGVCCLGTLLSIVLTVRTRPVYAMLYSGGSFRVPRSSGHWSESVQFNSILFCCMIVFALSVCLLCLYHCVWENFLKFGCVFLLCSFDEVYTMIHLYCIKLLRNKDKKIYNLMLFQFSPLFLLHYCGIASLNCIAFSICNFQPFI